MEGKEIELKIEPRINKNTERPVIGFAPTFEMKLLPDQLKKSARSQCCMAARQPQPGP